MRLWLYCAALLVMLSGCARYEYDVVRPPESAQHIGSQADVVIVRDPVIYRMRTAENHLVIRIQNPTDDRVQFEGAQSFEVDPQGESRPLRSQTIAPHAFIKLILPPMPPQPVPTGPTIGFGIGAGFGLVYPDNYADPLWDRPRYFMVYDADVVDVWEWPADSDVRLNLTFRRDEQQPFSQEFVFRRKKM